MYVGGEPYLDVRYNDILQTEKLHGRVFVIQNKGSKIYL